MNPIEIRHTLIGQLLTHIPHYQEKNVVVIIPPKMEKIKNTLSTAGIYRIVSPINFSQLLVPHLVMVS
jgi:hypothetical protein